MLSSCYVVEVSSNYTDPNAGISLSLSLIENKNRVLCVWFVNTHWAHFNPMGCFVIFSALLPISVSKGVTQVLVTKGASLRRLKNYAYLHQYGNRKQSLVSQSAVEDKSTKGNQQIFIRFTQRTRFSWLVFHKKGVLNDNWQTGSNKTANNF